MTTAFNWRPPGWFTDDELTRSYNALFSGTTRLTNDTHVPGDVGTAHLQRKMNDDRVRMALESRTDQTHGLKHRQTKRRRTDNERMGVDKAPNQLVVMHIRQRHRQMFDSTGARPVNNGKRIKRTIRD